MLLFCLQTTAGHIIIRKAKTVTGKIGRRLAHGRRCDADKARAQHVPLAENGRGHGGGVAVVSVGDGQGLVRALAAVDAALLHDPGQSLGQGLAQQLPLSGAGDGDHGVPVGDGGGEAAGAVEGVAELRRKVLQSPKQGILLENDLPLPGGVDLQRVAVTDNMDTENLVLAAF